MEFSMIKKLILICLLASSVAFAMTIDGVDTLVINTEDGVLASSINTEDGVTIASNLCPSYYNTAGVILSMNFENGLNACDSSGNAVLFTGSGTQDIGAYGDAGGQALKVSDGADNWVTFTQSAAQYVNEDADQTLCMKVYVTDQLSATTGLARLHDADYSDEIRFELTPDNPAELASTYATTGDDEYINETVTTEVTWINVSYSWEGTAIATGGHSTSAGGAYDEVVELATGMTDAITILQIGGTYGNPGNYFIIDEWALIGSYEFDCSTLF